MPAKKRSKKANPANKAYLAEHRWDKNKKLKIEKHQINNINDKQELGIVPDYTSKKIVRYDFGLNRLKENIKTERRK